MSTPFYLMADFKMPLHPTYISPYALKACCSVQLSDELNVAFCSVCGHGSSVGIATGYGLDGPGIESRWG